MINDLFSPLPIGNGPIPPSAVAGAAMANPPARDSRNLKTRLFGPDEVREIRRLYKETGKTYAQIGRRFGCSPGCVGVIVRRECYKEVQ